jgi:hypothetical protein
LRYDLIGLGRRLSPGAGYPGDRGSESRVGIELLRAGFAADVAAAVATEHHLIRFFGDLASLEQVGDLFHDNLWVFSGEAGEWKYGTGLQTGATVGAPLGKTPSSVVEIVRQVSVLLHLQARSFP